MTQDAREEFILHAFHTGALDVTMSYDTVRSFVDIFPGTPEAAQAVASCSFLTIEQRRELLKDDDPKLAAFIAEKARYEDPIDAIVYAIDDAPVPEDFLRDWQDGSTTVDPEWQCYRDWVDERRADEIEHTKASQSRETIFQICEGPIEMDDTLNDPRYNPLNYD